MKYLGVRCDGALRGVRLYVHVANRAAGLQHALEAARRAHEPPRREEPVDFRRVARVVHSLFRVEMRSGLFRSVWSPASGRYSRRENRRLRQRLTCKREF